ncbi:MAG: hypothetical protein JXA18_12340 [Chitinispirillaceae bacterium]|nr:hypothetical protein [Chitinispirillaceae bacterium]
MLKRNATIRGLLFFMSIVAPVFSQGVYWPGELAVPPAAEAAPADGDSTVVSLSSQISLYQTFKARNRLDLRDRLPWGSFDQSVDYQFSQLNPQSRIQSADFSGSLIRRNVLVTGLDAGFDWTPIVSYSRRKTGTMQSSADIGPVINHSVASIPYSLRGGLYGYAWNDSIASLFSAPLDDYHGDPGVYGNCSIGDPARGIGSLPIHIGIDATGRAIRGNPIGLFSGSILYADDLPFFGGGDSLFLHAGDSITNGKELYIGEFEGKSLLSNTSWRINHAFSASGGFASKERFGIQSQLYYRYYLNSIAYPSKSKALDDIRTAGHILGLGVRIGEDLLLSYDGGIEFMWEFEDWLYRQHFGDDIYATGTNRDSLIVNQSDHFSDIARTDHEVRLTLPWGFGACYTLYAFKDSKRYPFEFMDPASSQNLKRNQNENDRVQIDQKVSLRFDRDSLLFVETYGSYDILYHYYYRSQRSAESRQTREYRIGLDVGVSSGPLDFREHIYADAEVSDYYFKNGDGIAPKAPPYARDVTSTLSGEWKIRENRFHLTGRWVEMYHDNGFWYGNDYRPDSSRLDREYYAIERKGTQYWLDFAFDIFLQRGKFTVGSTLRDVFQQQFDRRSDAYVVSELDLGYGIEPYVRCSWHGDIVLLNMRVKRIFNTQDEERWNREKNWDLSLSLQMVF